MLEPLDSQPANMILNYRSKAFIYAPIKNTSFLNRGPSSETLNFSAKKLYFSEARLY